MATVRLLADAELSAEALSVFEDIRRTRGTDYINNFWRGLAHDPKALAATWEEVKREMAPGALDALTKELIYVAVSVANSCSYCTHSHTASARAKGMSEAQHAELLRVIALAGKTNHLANAMQLPIDGAFEQNGTT